MRQTQGVRKRAKTHHNRAQRDATKTRFVSAPCSRPVIHVLSSSAELRNASIPASAQGSERGSNANLLLHATLDTSPALAFHHTECHLAETATHPAGYAYPK